MSNQIQKTKFVNSKKRTRNSKYGLKQAARGWHIKIAEPLKKNNFVKSTADACLFTRKEKENSAYIIVYDDDILITSENEIVKQIVKRLRKEYDLKNLGDVSQYLGTQINKTQEGYTLNQKLKIEEIVEKFNFENAKPVGYVGWSWNPVSID